jgi:hypothetical protein
MVVATRASLANAGWRDTAVSGCNSNGQRYRALAGAASGAEGRGFEAPLAH